MDITGIGSIFDFGSKVIDKLFPDKNEAEKAKIAMIQLQQEGAFKELELEYKAAAEQIAVNMKEAEHPSVFVSGARPAAMWVCVAGFGYNFIIFPLLSWASLNLSWQVLPVIDSTIMMNLLFGMLGLAGFRSYDKKNGVASK